MDREAEFGEFVRTRWSALVGTAYLVTADRGIAEDCVQEALNQVYRRWTTLTLKGEPVGYARRAAINAALSRRRRRRVAEVPLDAAAEPAAPDDPVAAVDPQLVAALRSLPPRMRAAVVLRFIEDRSEGETAELLGCTVGTVKSATSRGIARLRAALEPGGEGSEERSATPIRGGRQS